MSHFERIKTNIRNIDHLKEALDSLGYTYQAGSTATVSGYGSRTQQVELVITLPGNKFQIGFSRNAQGNYEMVADWYLSSGLNRGDFTHQIENEIKKIDNRIKREIARKTILDNLKKQGFTLVEEETAQNEVFLHLRRLA